MRITSADLAAHTRLRTRPEKEIQKEVLAYLQTVRGVVAWRQNTGSAMLPGKGGVLRPVRFGFRGMADIIGWVKWPQVIAGEDAMRLRYGGPARPMPAVGDWIARFLAIECKRVGEKPTPEQAAFLEMVRRAGGIALVATCVQDVVRVLPQ